jgi:hypothetical protein
MLYLACVFFYFGYYRQITGLTLFCPDGIIILMSDFSNMCKQLDKHPPIFGEFKNGLTFVRNSQIMRNFIMC